MHLLWLHYIWNYWIHEHLYCPCTIAEVYFLPQHKSCPTACLKLSLWLISINVCVLTWLLFQLTTLLQILQQITQRRSMCLESRCQIEQTGYLLSMYNVNNVHIINVYLHSGYVLLLHRFFTFFVFYNRLHKEEQWVWSQDVKSSRKHVHYQCITLIMCILLTFIYI